MWHQVTTKRMLVYSMSWNGKAVALWDLSWERAPRVTQIPPCSACTRVTVTGPRGLFLGGTHRLQWVGKFTNTESPNNRDWSMLLFFLWVLFVFLYLLKGRIWTSSISVHGQSGPQLVLSRPTSAGDTATCSAPWGRGDAQPGGIVLYTHCLFSGTLNRWKMW